MKRVLYIQYTNPGGYPPLEHSSRILAEAGWKILFLGTGVWGADSLEFATRPDIRVRRMSFSSSGWRQKVHYLVYSLWCVWIALTWRPSLVYASDVLSCPIALALTWAPGLRVFYHEHDEPRVSDSRSLFQSLIERSRKWLARRGDLCILPNETRLRRFQEELRPVRSSVCVWNCPAADEITPEPREKPQGPIRVIYHGSIVPDRLPLTVVDALALLGESICLRVVGYETVGSHGYVEELRQRAVMHGVANRVEFLGALPMRGDLLRTTRSSDIGLALMPQVSDDVNLRTMTGASNKAFDYLACGLPVVVSNLPDWRDMFVAPGYGVVCDPGDARSIADAIRSLAEYPDRMRAMGEAGRQRILTQWNYENVFRPVLQHISNPEGAVKDAAGSRVQIQDVR